MYPENILNWAENAISLAFQKNFFHRPVFQFAVFLSDIFYPGPWFHSV